MDLERYIDRQHLWLFSLPSLTTIILLAIIIFIVLRRMSKRRSRDRMLQEVYGKLPTLVMSKPAPEEKDPPKDPHQAV